MSRADILVKLYRGQAEVVGTILRFYIHVHVYMQARLNVRYTC